ncbi:hypothetical protein BC936DRAFT_137222 [Jimgerdemannia flammicorona]|uniref:Uncharacterized protein n=2 Tax=Jimgerdemannia flammicorona TaxID=994334 RepID=A0A433CXV0_9FUNG|nr:hypothetical protein BC936DRAFT_137222 [Jimgerdemannia flammicorona]RUS26177.1 hypothetical protein BC938DRAFT_471134 [Jimgerdemannia flammicorona]
MLLPHFPFGFLVSGQHINLNKYELKNEQLKYTNRFVDDETWPAEKAKTPFIPVMRPDGTKFVLAKSNAITRYLARKYGFFGDNEDDTARIDMIYEAWTDITFTFLRKGILGPEEKKAENVRAFFEEDFAFFVAKNEEMLASSTTGHYVGNKVNHPPNRSHSGHITNTHSQSPPRPPFPQLSIADIKAWDRLQAFAQIQPERTAAVVNPESAPRLYELWRMIDQDPKITEWRGQL